MLGSGISSPTTGLVRYLSYDERFARAELLGQGAQAAENPGGADGREVGHRRRDSIRIKRSCRPYAAKEGRTSFDVFHIRRWKRQVVKLRICIITPY